VWAADESSNSIGIVMARIEPASFDMGVDSVPLDAWLIQGISGSSYDRQSAKGDSDEVPVHKVTISTPFWIGVTEITADQFRQFRPDYRSDAHYAPYATGVSW